MYGLNPAKKRLIPKNGAFLQRSSQYFKYGVTLLKVHFILYRTNEPYPFTSYRVIHHTITTSKALQTLSLNRIHSVLSVYGISLP